QHQFALCFAIEAIGLQEQTLTLHRAREISLGKRRPLVGSISLVADHLNHSGKAFGPQARHGLRPRLAGADDNNSLHLRLTFAALCGRSLNRRRKDVESTGLRLALRRGMWPAKSLSMKGKSEGFVREIALADEA